MQILHSPQTLPGTSTKCSHCWHTCQSPCFQCHSFTKQVVLINLSRGQGVTHPNNPQDVPSCPCFLFPFLITGSAENPAQTSPSVRRHAQLSLDSHKPTNQNDLSLPHRGWSVSFRAQNGRGHGGSEIGCALLLNGIPAALFPSDLSDEENVSKLTLNTAAELSIQPY